MYHHGLADEQQQQSLLCVLLRAKQTVERRRRRGRRRRTEGLERRTTFGANKQTNRRACALLSRVHPWASAQTVALAVGVSLPRGIVQRRHRGRVLQRGPVTLLAHPSEEDLCELSGDGLRSQRQDDYCSTVVSLCWVVKECQVCRYIGSGAPWWKAETHHAQALRGSALHSAKDLTEAAHSSRQVALRRRKEKNDDQFK